MRGDKLMNFKTKYSSLTGMCFETTTVHTADRCSALKLTALNKEKTIWK